jgi:membrane protease YdiL (CAAX protease family)
VAAPWHTVVFLLVLASLSFRAMLSHQPAELAQGSGAAAHASLVRKYLLILAEEAGLVAWIWAGVQWKGGRFRDLIGGCWNSWRAVAADVVLAFAYWIVWELAVAAAHWAVDRFHPARATYHGPSGVAEIFLWFLVSLAAGFAEELAYRGYFQRQFQALTGSLPVAIVLQGIVFGMGHTYQGWGQVVVITAIGILDGIFVAWRGNLRAAMISHAWADVFEGYLRSNYFPGA